MQIPGYDDVALIAHGGFATVFRARQVAFERDVAVKVLTVELDQDRDRTRFQREVAAMGRLTGHPHIVTILDSGFTPDGRPYLTTPYYPQGSLGQQLARSGPFAVREVLDIGVAMAGALDAAHRRGILHRDVKPENILLSRYGEAALTDFGIATDAGPDLSSSTHTTQAFTLGHAPPEVLEGGRATEASDVYSLASSLWMLLAGRTPFGGPADEGLIPRVMRVKTEPVPPIGRSDVPPTLERALTAAMAKEPRDRILPAAAFGRALQDIQRELGLPVSELRTESVVDLRTDAVDQAAPDATGIVGAPVVPAVPAVPVVPSAHGDHPVPRWQGGNTRAATPAPVDLWAEPAWRDESGRDSSGARPGPAAAAPTGVAPTEVVPIAAPVPHVALGEESAQNRRRRATPAVALEPLEPLDAPRPARRPPPGGQRPESRRGAPVAPPPGRRPALTVLVVVLVLIAGAGVGYAAMRSRSNLTTTDAGPTTVPPTTTPPTTLATVPTTAAPPSTDPAATTPATSTPPTPTTPAPATTAAPAPAGKTGELIAPADLPAPAVDAATVAQQAATALAVGQWDTARALVPSLGGSDNQSLAKAWAGLNFATLVVTDWKPAKNGAVSLRLGEVAHESSGDVKRTNLYCVTWTVSGGHIVAMADQQLIDPQPWRAGEWVDPAVAADVLRAQCRKL